MSHPQNRAVRSVDEEMASVMSIATEVTKQTSGQNAPALVSQTVPFQRKYWAMPTPNIHGMTPNTVAVTNSFPPDCGVLHAMFLPENAEERTGSGVAHYSGH